MAKPIPLGIKVLYNDRQSSLVNMTSGTNLNPQQQPKDGSSILRTKSREQTTANTNASDSERNSMENNKRGSISLDRPPQKPLPVPIRRSDSTTSNQ